MKLTLAKTPTASAVKYEERYGAIEPDDLPYQLEWPSLFPPEGESAYECVEYGKLLAKCLERGKPVTVREYVDLFWLDGGTYRWNDIAETSYKEFVAKVSAVQFFA